MKNGLSGFKKKPIEDELDGYSDYDEESKYGTRSYYTTQSKGTLSVNTSDLKHVEAKEVQTPAPIPTRSTEVASRGVGRVARLFKFGKKSDRSETSEDAHEKFARGRTTHQPIEKTLDESDSIVDPNKVWDDDHVDADERIKDFERRMKAMKQSMVQKQSMIQRRITEEEESSSDGSSSHDSSVPKKIGSKKKKRIS